MFTNALVVGFAIVIAAGPAAAQSKDPCSLLKAAEVQQVLGLKAHISDGVSSPPGGPGVAGCVYKWPDGKAIADTRVDSGRSKWAGPHQNRSCHVNPNRH